MHSKQPDLDHARPPSGAHARKPGIAKFIGRLILIAVLGLAFLGYLTPDMRIQWANLMTLCGF